MHFDVYSVRDKYWPRISTPEILLLWLKENVKERPKVKRTFTTNFIDYKKTMKIFRLPNRTQCLITCTDFF